MCGIAGIVGRVTDPQRAALRAMAASMQHRGPDAGGFWESEADADGRGCLLAFRRLAILDLSAAADQPMTDPVGGQTMVFNGEIYNYVALRDELRQDGERFDSSGDTAVMLRLLARQGADACARLRGMFAFALWDPEQRTLSVARDPHGIKPLYVCQNPDPDGDWSLVFASELRSILASGLLGPPRLDPAAVASVVWNGFVMGPGTAVAGVSSLLPGGLQVYDRQGRLERTTTFWTAPVPDRTAPPSAPAQVTGDLQEALADSVRLHLAADVPLGVFLSGGVDSGVIANLAQQAQPDRRVQTFTLAFEEAELSEGDAARAIADAIGTEHQEILLTESAFVDGLEGAIDTLDQPTFDGLNSYYMAKAVREAGLTVALAGTGGDELFGGYETFRYLPSLLTWSARGERVPAGVKRSVAKAVRAARQRGAAGSVPPQSKWAKLPAMVDAGADILALYQLSYALFLPEFQQELLAGPVLPLGLNPEMRERLMRETAGRRPLDAVGALEQRCFLGERLLRDSDAASMAVSLELRVPLVDQVVTEHVGGMPERARFDPVGQKEALRAAGLQGLDPGLFDRPKQGFQLPFDRWIRENLGTTMDETMRDGSAAAAVGLDGAVVARLWDGFQGGAPGIYWSRVWAVYVLIRWCQAHGVYL
jgi:asparagine synthase (glutamine-hydrolysing)